MTTRVLALTRYGASGASSRLRFVQYLALLDDGGLNCQVEPLFTDTMLLRKYRSGRYSFLLLVRAYVRRIAVMLTQSRNFDLFWIEKEALPWCPAWMEKALLGRRSYVLDYDDAIFHNYDRHHRRVVRWFLGDKIDRLIRDSDAVVAGNDYLALRATTAGAPVVRILPTAVDASRYRVKSENTNGATLTIVWIGTPSTVKYLSLIQQPLRELSMVIPFTLRVIGADAAIPGVHVECVPWTESTEVDLLRSADIGIMPLLDTPWEQGKCAYKLIQYMACGLPTVASPVGANVNVTVAGETGFLPSSDTEWYECLRELLGNAGLRRTLGLAGRSRVEKFYSVRVTAPLLLSILKTRKDSGCAE